LFTVGIITVSDKGYAGKREDISGPVIEEMIKTIDGKVVDYVIIPDEVEKIKDALVRMVDEKQINLVFTTGGTGFSPRDVTPEATLAVIEKQVPGIPEAMRMISLETTTKAMLSRAVAGIRKSSLIINLPGSPRAVRENLEVILPALPHGLLILQGKTGECGSSH
jgi:molybdenum cofactor synthesis domain-containing protein